MEFILPPILAFGVALLTFFSGFGLGTLLLPALMLFYPPEQAIAFTALIHLLNNLYKLKLMGRFADRRVLLLFGLPALLAAFIGAGLLLLLSDKKLTINYQLSGANFETTSLNLVLAALMMLFALMELPPGLRTLQAGKVWLVPGGLLSGFFGGLSGHQGALRAVFLLKAGLGKEAFIGTGVVLACLIDVTRLSVYLGCLRFGEVELPVLMLLLTSSAAWLGTWLGNRLLKKTTLQAMKYLVAALLMMVSMGLALGLV